MKHENIVNYGLPAVQLPYLFKIQNLAVTRFLINYRFMQYQHQDQEIADHYSGEVSNIISYV